MSNVVELFGKFAIENAKGEIVTYESKEEAVQASILEANEAKFTELAEGYCEAKGYTGRAVPQKVNVIKDFLAYQASLEG